MAKIKSIDGLEILDSRGNPTLKVWVGLDDGTISSASVPSGASTGKLEAFEPKSISARFHQIRQMR